MPSPGVPTPKLLGSEILYQGRHSDMPRYAESTTVPAGRSREEIERIVDRFGANRFAYGWEEGLAVIEFRARGKLVRFTLPLPDKDDPTFRKTPTGRIRYDDETIRKEWEKAIRSKWRSLALVVKAKLVAVEDEIVSFEQEFLPHFVLPNGATVAEWALPLVEGALETDEMPRLGSGSGS